MANDKAAVDFNPPGWVEFLNSLGDNYLSPPTDGITEEDMADLYAEGMTPDKLRGTPKEHEQYAAYYAKQKGTG